MLILRNIIVTEVTQLEDPRLEWLSIQEAMLREYLHTAQEALEVSIWFIFCIRQRISIAKSIILKTLPIQIKERNIPGRNKYNRAKLPNNQNIVCHLLCHTQAVLKPLNQHENLRIYCTLLYLNII